MGKHHVIAIPYPGQGHVIPMLELSQQLVTNGIKVTFVNSEIDHHRILESLSESNDIRKLVDMVSIRDGMEPWEDRKEIGRFFESTFRVMPRELEALIQRINGSTQGDKITCILADWCSGWAFEVAEKLGLGRAAFYPASAAVLAVASSIPKLISDGIIGSDGRVLTAQTIQLSPDMPEMNSSNLLWRCLPDEAANKAMFDVLVKDCHSAKLAQRLICNSSIELEPAAFSQFPNFIPVGPILASNRLGKAAGHFWPEDSACLPWLDQQPTNTVIYVAFGSFAVMDQTQFEELALGLELTNRPFLWVVRQDITPDADNRYPTGFKESVQDCALMVEWAPQQQVLSHPSVAIFISHCGWNSTIEGIANGIPFLCWPSFSDQFLNQTYICDEWKIGLGFNKDESGIIRKGEIKDKVEHVLWDKSYKERALNLQAKTMASVREGCSHKNFTSFIQWIKNN